MIGVVACDLAVLPADADRALVRATTRLLGIAIGLATLAAFGILLSRTLEMNGGTLGTLWPDIGPALTLTHFGHIWRWRIPALALAWLAWFWAKRHPRRAWTSWLIALAAATIALTRSDTGHPADHGDFTIAVWVDWGHILAAGTWVGSLFGMTLAVYPKLLRRAGRSVAQSADIFQRLSTLSGAALAVLLGCGIYSAIRQLDGFASLWTSRYGIILDVKLAIVLTMIAIGAHNRYIKLPRLLGAARRAVAMPVAMPVAGRVAQAAWQVSGAASVRRCARAVLLESVLGLAVIGATAVLIHAMPPADWRGMRGTHDMDARSTSHPAISPVVAVAARRYDRGDRRGDAHSAGRDFSSTIMGIRR